VSRPIIMNKMYAAGALALAFALNLGQAWAGQEIPTHNEPTQNDRTGAPPAKGQPRSGGATRGASSGADLPRRGAAPGTAPRANGSTDSKTRDGQAPGAGRGNRGPAGPAVTDRGTRGGRRTDSEPTKTPGGPRDSRPEGAGGVFRDNRDTRARGGRSADGVAQSPRPGRSRSNTYAGRPGDRKTALSGGRTEFRNSRGETVRTNGRGQITRIEGSRGTRGTIAVNRSSRGERMVVTGRPGDRVVSYGSRRGFVERSVRPGYISRTYVNGRRPYAHVYREYRYRGFLYYRYVPAVYYGPRFYGWVISPWFVPVRSVWFGVHRPAPWLGLYAGYFTPYPMYSSADSLLTDYLLAANLRLAYESQQAGNAGKALQPASVSTNGPTLSPEMKALIASEVRQQLADMAKAQTTTSALQPAANVTDQLPPALNQRFFVVSSNLDVTAAGQACSLTPGDIIQRKGKDVTPDGTIEVEVIASKPGNCAAESRIGIGIADLQEMQNQFREQLDLGLKALADNEAAGLPKAPMSDARVVSEGTAAPAMNAEAQVAAQEADAAELEAQVNHGSGD
jgi:hypothetical protein